MSKPKEYQAFEALLGEIAKTPHSKIKAELEAEKLAKKKPSKKKVKKNV